MGKDARAALASPDEILLVKARSYAYRGRYLQIQVFTKHLSEVECLEKKFGGRHYRHGTGFSWVIANRQKLIGIVDTLRDQLPSENGFEVPIIENYY